MNVKLRGHSRIQMNKFKFGSFLWMLMVGVLIVGCQRSSDELPAKSPRPITAFVLRTSAPTGSFTTSGSVQSWKKEDIGFDLSGRIQWVLEPGRNIDGQVIDADGRQIAQGTPLAKIEVDRYEVAVASAKATLDVATLDKKVAEIQLRQSIPTEFKAAQSDLALAQVEYERLRKLRGQNAVAASDFDAAANRLQTQRARLDNLEATQNQAMAELKAAEARELNSQQQLRDAERNLRNTTLFASYRGQISDVHVVPGSVVNAGSPVLTLQMMDPIKVEIEVSADQSRIIQRRRQVPISFTAADGTVQNRNAFVYMVDPSADPSTRTFSATLLIRNQKIPNPLPEAVRDLPIAQATDVWPVDLGQIVGTTSGDYQIEEKSIFGEGDQKYVWQVTNATFGQGLPQVLKVRKLPITPADVRISFLGNWVFRPVTFPNLDAPPDSEAIVIGSVDFPDGWDGESVVVQGEPQWLLRPGDLVNVYLDDDGTSPGFFVSVDAIYEQSGSTYVFAVEGESARRIEVAAVLPENLDRASQIQIKPIQSGDLFDGMQLVMGGVHFLNDGDRVVVTKMLDDASQAVTASPSSMLVNDPAEVGP